MNLKPIILTAAFTVGTALADAPIEQDAIGVDQHHPELVQALTTLVQLNGYRCDSVSALIKYVWGNGYTLNCNQFQYTYEIKDVGGRWSVEVGQ